jgi:hypothetical protein
VLPLSAIDSIGTMLSFSSMDAPYLGLSDVAAACEPRSLAEFSWDVARGWELAGGKTRSKFMLESLAYFADDEVTRRTTPAIRARYIVDVLRSIGTDAAVMELATIAYRGSGSSAYFSSETAAEEQLAEIAIGRGLSKDDLEDLIVPTVQVDDKCTIVLDYGPRKIRVGFDEHLDPYIDADDGKRLRALPPKRKTDDPEKISAAKAIWHELKEDVSAIAARRISSLERAMTTGRTWSKRGWETAWLASPLMFHLARRVIWVEQSTKTTFRLSEDRTLADQNDASFELTDESLIGVAYPYREKGLDVWISILMDYELVQPFAQVARPLPKLAGDEMQREEVVKKRGDKIDAGELASRLRTRGWKRVGYYGSFRTPGVQSVDARFQGHGGIDQITLRFFVEERPVTASALDPIVVGEALYDLGL